MSILIKGMEMPKDCPYCSLAHWNFKNEFTGCEIVKKYFSTEELYAEGRPEFCPLVPVPPHGRLIDADVLQTDYFVPSTASGMPNYYYVSKKQIDEAQTIIPAEEGE